MENYIFNDLNDTFDYFFVSFVQIINFCLIIQQSHPILIFYSATMNTKYPSNISKKIFQTILPVLEKSRKKTKPRKVDLYEVFCAILYVLKSGCQWRMLRRDFPKWKTVYFYFQQWNEPREATGVSLLEEALKKSDYKI